MLLSCADQNFSQQLQPPKSSRKRAVSTFSPFSATPQQRASPRSALQAYLRENLFLKALIVFAIMGAISATEEGKKPKSNTKTPHENSSHRLGEQRAVQSCFLHGKKTEFHSIPFQLSLLPSQRELHYSAVFQTAGQTQRVKAGFLLHRYHQGRLMQPALSRKVNEMFPCARHLNRLHHPLLREGREATTTNPPT